MICGRGTSKRVIHIDSRIEALPTHLPHILPAVHALTGCDSTSKIATKLTALKIACSKKGHLMTNFINKPFSDVTAIYAEQFLVNCLKPKCREISFDELRYAIYHNKTTNLDLKKFPCTSESLKLHIRRAYFQELEWNRAPFQSCHHLNPLEYGYIL